jgi:hypothetical protein
MVEIFSIFWKGRWLCSFPKVQSGFGAHPPCYPMGTRTGKLNYIRLRRGGVALTTHLHLVSRIRMSGDVSPFVDIWLWRAKQQKPSYIPKKKKIIVVDTRFWYFVCRSENTVVQHLASSTGSQYTHNVRWLCLLNGMLYCYSTTSKVMQGLL